MATLKTACAAFLILAFVTRALAKEQDEKTLDDVFTEISSMKSQIQNLERQEEQINKRLDKLTKLEELTLERLTKHQEQTNKILENLVKGVDLKQPLLQGVDLKHPLLQTKQEELNHSPTQTKYVNLSHLSPQPSVCTAYTPLSDAWRHIDYLNRAHFKSYCDKSGSESWIIYTNLIQGWYRFTGAGGTKLPIAPATGGPPAYGYQTCGTLGVAYIASGDNPSMQDGIVTRDVCFERDMSSCSRNTTIKMAACSDIYGEYLVYELKPVTSCSDAYCAID